MVSLVKTRSRPPQAQYDELLIWVLIGLLALGLVMVYSASIATAEAGKFTGYHRPIICCDTACSSRWAYLPAIRFPGSGANMAELCALPVPDRCGFAGAGG